MALFIRQEEQRSELQNRLATELQDKARQRAKMADRPDGVEDSEYIKGTEKTSSLAWVWIIIGLIAVGIIIWLIVLSMAR
jgi:hypothetical protein